DATHTRFTSPRTRGEGVAALAPRITHHGQAARRSRRARHRRFARHRGGDRACARQGRRARGRGGAHGGRPRGNRRRDPHRRRFRAMDPLLRLSAAGRAVFITSGAAWIARAYWGPYAISKAALEVLARTYAAETESTPVRVNLFNPGPIRTRMRAQAMPGEDPAKLDKPHQVAEKILELCLPSFSQTGKLYDYP